MMREVDLNRWTGSSISFNGFVADRRGSHCSTTQCERWRSASPPQLGYPQRSGVRHRDRHLEVCIFAALCGLVLTPALRFGWT